MRRQFLVGYTIAVIFILIALIRLNFEFLIYATSTALLVAILHITDKRFTYNGWTLWGFNVWMISHIFGGLLIIGGVALYSVMLIPLVGEPYLILKYDQIIHVFCYFIIALLMWSVIKHNANKKASFGILAFITVMAASGIGGLNEIIEFSTTLFFDNNVGGYENTAIDIVANLLGALIAIPFMKKIK